MQTHCLKCKKEIRIKNKKEDKTYYFSCRNYTGNVNTSKVRMINKVARK